MLIDTHCHLDDPKYEEGIEPVLARAVQSGVTRCITIGTDVASSQKAIEIASRYAGVCATVGLHPHEASTWTDEMGAQLDLLAGSAKVVGIGEIGLDYYRNHSPREIQHEAFRKMLALARRRDLPVIIHCREDAQASTEGGRAWDDCFGLLREVLPVPMKGVMHCFSGGPRELTTALDLGFDISFAGNLTFKNAAVLRDVAQRVPIDRVVLETDAPYLTPEPHRGKRNEPAFVDHTARFFAQLRSLSLEEVRQKTSENATRLFRLPVLDEAR